MKTPIFSFITKLVVILMLIERVAHSIGIFTPHIENHGSYKPNHSSSEPLTPLFGHVPADVRDSTRLAPVRHDRVLNLSIALPLNNEEELDQWLLEISDPHSPFYRLYMSHDAFVARYAPTVEQVAGVQAHLEANGLMVTSVDANRLIVHVTGAVHDINNVFNTEIYYFDHQGETFYAPLYELQIESSVSIHSVHGLENHFHAHPYFKKLKNSEGSVASKNNPSGLTPAQIKSAYSMTSTLTGAGQTLALFELDGYSKSDILAYERAFNLPNVPLKNVFVDNATGVPGDGAGEVTLDIELMIALAPGVSQIIVYEGPNSSAGVLDTYNRIATDNLASSISSSWGENESASTGSMISAEALVFKQMAAQGQTIFAAAGDSGAYDDGSRLSVDDPASQPLVVGVGGTSLSTNSDGSYQSETTWSSGFGPGNSGGGGGISSVWSIPAWQHGVLGVGSSGSTTMRNVPDVALDADPNTGYAIYFGGQWQVYGGTSCAAPLWAALTALANQNLKSSGNSVVGFANPTFYQLGQSANYNDLMHDISDNSNNGNYRAVVGYDLATGWGTPYIDQVVSSLSGGTTNPPASCVLADPSVTITPSSQTSQPGAAVMYTVNITNNDNDQCAPSTYNLLAQLPNGFSVNFAQNSVTLPYGQSTTVQAIVTSPSSSGPGDYSFSIHVVNAADNTVSASVAGDYVIGGAQVPGPSITVTPQDGGGSYSQDINDWAKFTIAVSDGKKGIAEKPIKFSIDGPVSWKDHGHSGWDGTSEYWIFISPSAPVGDYTMTVTAVYKGKTLSGQTVFTVY